MDRKFPGRIDTGWQPPIGTCRMSGLAKLTPMDAVSALYSGQDWALSEAIVGSLSRAVFGEGGIKPAGLVQRAMARASYRHLKRTTTRVDHPESSGFSNRLLERSGHPYARSLLSASRKEIEALVEGGDPMNGPYMMLAPEIRGAGSGWDRIFFNSVQGRDVQLRFIWETRATYEEAKRRLEQGASVRLKALAAGTGLSMILAWDRLVRDGFDPAEDHGADHGPGGGEHRKDQAPACQAGNHPAGSNRSGRGLRDFCGDGGYICRRTNVRDRPGGGL